MDRRRSSSTSRDSHSKRSKNVHLEILGYTDDTNPFGDSKLSDRFVWDKKLEQQGRRYDADKEETRMRNEFFEEISQAKRSREERIRITEEREAERIRELSEKSTNFAWNLSDEQFALQQALLRAQSRVKSNRCKDIDLLWLNINDDYSCGRLSCSPEEMLDRLSSQAELEDALGEIFWRTQPKPQSSQSSVTDSTESEGHVNIDNSTHSDFWKSLLLLCRIRLDAIQSGFDTKIALYSPIRSADEQGVHALVVEDIKTHLRSLSASRLEELLKNIYLEVELGKRNKKVVDIDFFSECIRLALVERARSVVASVGEDLNAIAKQTQGNRKEMMRSFAERSLAKSERSKVHEKETEFAEEVMKEIMSEPLDELDELLQPVDDSEKHSYGWEDKYRPRKPRFFNRIHFGYDWNKYNQTHYDTENPPPKVVQGYKFNIFYPDLIDVSKAPRYKVVDNDAGTQFLIFSSGPPYEDIGFQIVRKEWENSHKRGFVSSFDRGVLRLYFNFKRHRYRR